MLSSYLPILVLLLVAITVAILFTLAARLLGPRRPTAEKSMPYESGMDPEGTPQIKFNVQFYRVALLFLVFDIETAFFYPWAVNFRELGSTGQLVNGILVMAVFLATLLLALAYVWRKRALEWD